LTFLLVSGLEFGLSDFELIGFFPVLFYHHPDFVSQFVFASEAVLLDLKVV